MTAKSKKDETVTETAVETVDSETSFVVPTNRPGFRLDDTLSAQINSIEDYERLTGRNVIDLAELIPSFEILNKETKDRLCGRHLLLLSWRFNESKKIIKDGHPAWFVSVLVLDVESGEKVIVNDGSTGIFQTLRSISESYNVQGGLEVKQGLRRSDYPYDEGDGNIVQATTYYLN